MVEIIPSILSADFARLGEQIAQVEAAGANILHLDVMDGHFVPNLTIGPPVVKSVRKITKMTLDVHLMITNPEPFVPVFIEAGADMVSVHQEVCPHLDRVLNYIQSEGARAGVVLNPSTPVATLEDVLDLADHVLVMSVNPGFGGQKFIPNSFKKVRQLVELRHARKLDFPIEIDGGIHMGNLADVVRAGVNWVVTGAAVFDTPDPGATVQEMNRVAREALSVRV